MHSGVEWIAVDNPHMEKVNPPSRPPSLNIGGSHSFHFYADTDVTDLPEFAAMHESAYGPKPTCQRRRSISAYRGKADATRTLRNLCC
jgi:hypothetical protein